MIFGLRAAKLLEEKLGEALDWIDVTTHGDPERQLLLATPLCAYCKTPNPSGHCKRCGASILRDGELR